jgi:exodeoxyribonuclease-1
VLRSSFYRNLLDPWFSSGRDVCRVDMLHIVRLVAAADPDALAISVHADGKRGWRLSEICEANGIPINAHDALGDVLALHEVTRAVIERCPDVWEVAQRCGRAATMDGVLAAASRTGEVVWLFTHYGKPDVIPCAVLATDGRKRWLAADLRAEEHPDDAAGIAGTLYAGQAAYRVIRASAVPLVIPQELAVRINPALDSHLYSQRADALRHRPGIAQVATAALRASEYSPRIDRTSEERIYDGFLSDAERGTIRRWRTADWQERAEIAFEDPRLVDFAARIIREAILDGRAGGLPQTLVDRVHARSRSAYERPYAGPDARWMTLARAAAKSPDDRWIEFARGWFGADEVDDALERARPPSSEEVPLAEVAPTIHRPEQIELPL